MSDHAATTPLSPHLQIWRWTVTLFCSIGHRLTGMALYSGTILLTIWLAAAATGEEAYSVIHGIYTSPVGYVVMIGYTWALFFHLANGIRHLVWDAGYGFSIPASRASAWAVVISSLVLTLAVWGAVFLTGGN